MVNAADLIDSGKSSDLLDLVSSVSHAKQRRRRPRTRKRDPQHVPRPTNCFMIYRLEMQRYIRTYCPNANHREISKIVAKWWHKEPLHVKEHFRALADKAKQEHKDMYPEYKYVPKKKPQKPKTANGQEQSNPTVAASPLSVTRTTATTIAAATSVVAATVATAAIDHDDATSHCAAIKGLPSCAVVQQQYTSDNDPDYSLYPDPPASLNYSHSTPHHSFLPATDDAYGTFPLMYYGASSSTSPLATPVWDPLPYVDSIVNYATLLDHSSQSYQWQQQSSPHQQPLVLSTTSALPTTTVTLSAPRPPPRPSLVEPLSYSYGLYPTYY